MNKPPACKRVFSLSYKRHNNTTKVEGGIFRYVEAIAQFYVQFDNSTAGYDTMPSGFGSVTSWWAFDGYIYLIDARDMAGYVIGVPEAYQNEPLLRGRQQQFLKETYEVNFIHAIPNTSIVGAVWSDNFVMDRHCRRSREWMGKSGFELMLGENPQYNGDAEGVAKLFK